mmetsp:Transcript_8136/g.17433  ORF Transcript_8136/g.17433 Transcript_8136/m.17433 type:complete len:233 (-) Transcript_8136:352-1050(-)
MHIICRFHASMQFCAQHNNNHNSAATVTMTACITTSQLTVQSHTADKSVNLSTTIIVQMAPHPHFVTHPAPPALITTQPGDQTNTTGSASVQTDQSTSYHPQQSTDRSAGQQTRARHAQAQTSPLLVHYHTDFYSTLGWQGAAMPWLLQLAAARLSSHPGSQQLTIIMMPKRKQHSVSKVKTFKKALQCEANTCQHQICRMLNFEKLLVHAIVQGACPGSARATGGLPLPVT